jgi:ATP-binding cassette subfamily B protein IrtA
MIFVQDTGIPESNTRVERHVVDVVGVRDLTPWYRRVDCAGHGLLPRLALAPGAYLLLHVPALPCPRAALPRPGDSDLGVEPATADRGYTIVQPDVGADRFALDFVLHQPAGPASAWAAAATVGATVAVSDPPYHLALPDPLAHALLIGDTSAAAGIDSILRRLPTSTQATVILADPHPDLDAIEFTDRDHTTIHRVPALPPDLLAATALDVQTDWLWAAGERTLAKQVRGSARNLALPRDRQHIQTYWIARD